MAALVGGLGANPPIHCNYRFGIMSAT